MIVFIRISIIHSFIQSNRTISFVRKQDNRIVITESIPQLNFIFCNYNGLNL